jgi:hypothetical protein
MATPGTSADRAAHRMEPVGKAAFIASVGVAYVLRGPAKAQEAGAAQGTPLDRSS